MADIKEEPVSTQPKGIVPMTVGGNKNAMNCPVGPDGKRDWSYGLFDCFSACGLCCFAEWCGCIVYGRNKQRLRSLQDQGGTLPAGTERTKERCCRCCTYFGFSTVDAGWFQRARYRKEIRERYGIRGSLLGDCCIISCCSSCSLTQESREIELEERKISSK